MKKTDIIAIISLVTILIMAICGFILIMVTDAWAAATLLILGSAMLCPLLELFPMFKEKMTDAALINKSIVVGDKHNNLPIGHHKRKKYGAKFDKLQAEIQRRGL